MQCIQSGLRWVIDLDLKEFFDYVNHDILKTRVARRVTDKRVLKLIHAYSNAGVMESGMRQKTEEGILQGELMSSLLADILLNDLDKEFLCSQQTRRATRHGIGHSLRRRKAETESETGQECSRPSMEPKVPGV